MFHDLRAEQGQARPGIGTQRRWVLDAIRLLSEINGGATAIPVEGAWQDDEGN